MIYRAFFFFFFFFAVTRLLYVSLFISGRGHRHFQCHSLSTYSGVLIDIFVHPYLPARTPEQTYSNRIRTLSSVEKRITIEQMRL